MGLQHQGIPLGQKKWVKLPKKGTAGKTQRKKIVKAIPVK